MIRFGSLLLLSSSMLSSPSLHAQSAAHRSVPARKTASPARSAVAATANKADTPPGVPPVSSAPKALYALRYVDIVTGTGLLAVPDKFYTVKYTGWLTDGTKFDSSYDHPGQEPITFPYGAHRVIPGWDTGFSGMRIGGKRRLYVPYQLAYGEAGREGAIPPKADLIFDIELVNFAAAPPAATPPPAPATPPAGSAAPAQPEAPAAQPSANPN